MIKKECRFTEFKQSIFYLLSFTKGQSNVFLDYKRGHGEIIFSPASATKVTETKNGKASGNPGSPGPCDSSRGHCKGCRLQAESRRECCHRMRGRTHPMP